MSTNREDAISKVVNDESLLGLRRAYHELELFQLSDAHLATKERLRERISEIKQQQTVTDTKPVASDSESV